MRQGLTTTTIRAQGSAGDYRTAAPALPAAEKDADVRPATHTVRPLAHYGFIKVSGRTTANGSRRVYLEAVDEADKVLINLTPAQALELSNQLRLLATAREVRA